MQTIFIIIFSVLSASVLTIASYKMLQIFQLSSYKMRGVLNWFKVTKLDYVARYFALAFLSFITMFVYIGCFGFNTSGLEWVNYLGSIFFIGFGIAFIIITLKQHRKTPLKFTKRVSRLIALVAIINLLLVGLILFFAIETLLSYAFVSIAYLLIPIVVSIAHYILLPIEKFHNMAYKSRAKSGLALNPHLVKIGITGSYGKTTAKNILEKMLSKKYRVCASPKSFNTTMGISLVVNDMLKVEDQVLIAEMGARNQGDIEELAKLIEPQYGVITAIGNQHLETFGDIETIIKTKYELIQNLALNGVGVFNGDNEYVKQKYEDFEGDKILTCEGDNAEATCTYKNVKIKNNCTEFELVIGEKIACVTTKLLGKHIPSLIALCSSIAIRMNVPFEDIVNAISELEPIEHRLQLIENGDTIVLDDAYNSNSEGARNALEVLSMFDGTRIIITPGLVELGAIESEANYELGKCIARCADYAIIDSLRANDITRGCIEAGMAQDRIIAVPTLAEAVAKSQEIQGKKVILFENDLPDNLK